MKKYPFLEALGQADEKYLEEVLEYSNLERSIAMKKIDKKKLGMILIAAVITIGATAVTVFSRNPSFEPDTYVLDIDDLEGSGVVFVHSQEEIDALPPRTPWAWAPGYEPEINVEESYAIDVVTDNSCVNIIDIQIDGDTATVYWEDEMEDETLWSVGISKYGESVMDDYEAYEKHYTFTDLEPGEYRVVVAGMTPDEEDPTQSFRMSTVMKFTIEE